MISFYRHVFVKKILRLECYFYFIFGQQIFILSVVTTQTNLKKNEKQNRLFFMFLTVFQYEFLVDQTLVRIFKQRTRVYIISVGKSQNIS